MDYLGKDIKKLGFGLMRLPMSEKDVDIEQTKEMVDLFMAKGFTYFDTAYGYIKGKSEEAVKTALVERYPRESFQLATKLPAWEADTAHKAKDMIYTSLERTGAGYFDYYLLHNVSASRNNTFNDFGIWDYVQELKAKGLVLHAGFSFHDKADVLDRILTEHPEAEFVQLQINYADWESESVQSRLCYEVALKHNKPIIIMEPIKGGALANPAQSVRKILQEANPKASFASWAIRFGASLDNIITVLSGMSTLEQMKDNLSYMDDFKPLSTEEKAVISQAQAAIAAIPSIPCTSCGYCLEECPQHINIPQVFEARNQHMVFDDLNGAKMSYRIAMMFGSSNPSKCIACSNCENVCPQQINIIETLKETTALLD
ncbi:aldo/keto reductase [Dehalobacter sp. DCM]|uniref:aldo/keto reductase n=1 Tax=Dehalobacter sp. DCM TaxID=2907827 RepID=UPI003081D929|nr:aldo/keto reductase [Dehalobacter sp. DCM]